ncbi:MAG: TolC family protein [Hydrogenophilaceae bacterium]|nr:TolC family protein [Hydrogenophilaceae bacterium]
MRGWLLVLQFAGLPALAQGPVLTLEAALAAVDAPHPQIMAAQADLNLALADLSLADSSKNPVLNLEGQLRRGQTTLNGRDWEDDHGARLVFRKPLLDFGRESGQVEAAKQEVSARRLALLDVRDARRIDIMARYFDVLLADAQYAADNEYMAVYYVSWDDAKKKFELGDMNPRDLAQLEARYQDQREKRNRSLLNVRTARQKLANAINRPGQLPVEVVPPALPQNELKLPDYEAMLPVAIKNNRQLLAQDARLKAVAARSEAIRADRTPTLDLELYASDYNRDTATRDRYSAGLVFSWPLYQGERIDSRLAREDAQRARLEAVYEQGKRDLADALLETMLEIEWLKTAARQAAKVQVEYRDQALERARGEYELELKTSLGTAMADTQVAAIRQKQVEYRLALAIARLEALTGMSLKEFAQASTQGTP